MSTDRHGMTVLSTHQCLELLRRGDVGRLAVCGGDHPEIFPINYVVDHGTIVFRTAEGTKLDRLVAERNVAFEVDGCESRAGVAWSVVIKGRAIEITGLQERFEALGLPLFSWQAAPKHHVVRLEPTEISGRRFTVVSADRWSTGAAGGRASSE
jgi:nitroimidazol reductase NimA-like FMN-containing flavoprotein (pyridoxamine 5'-phosphate oxidase superfamily)